jgi:hypothetical protein
VLTLELDVLVVVIEIEGALRSAVWNSAITSSKSSLVWAAAPFGFVCLHFLSFFGILKGKRSVMECEDATNPKLGVERRI